MPTIVRPTIFREYIGVKPYPPTLTNFPGDIINPKIPEFHFILGFAKEVYDTNRRGTGNFNQTWNVDDFSRENVEQLKQNHGNVKVLISIGGVGTDYPFDPAEIDVWPYNAIASLQQILNRYGGLIDGIDINYEVIINNSNNIDFANCIGKVINGLRNLGLIKLVSIAPSDQVQSHYSRLYVDHGRYIDWVNYKFYKQDVRSTVEFLNLYGELSNDYPAAKLLAGFSTDPHFQGVTLKVFLEGCLYLLRTESLPGIFVWNANDSDNGIFPFWVEYNAQILLINPPNP